MNCGKMITLAKYQKEAQAEKQKLFEEFKLSDETNVYEAVLNFRDDDEFIGYGFFTGVFKKFSSLQNYILKNRIYHLKDCHNEERIEKRMYWRVTKYTLYDGELEEDVVCSFSVEMEPLSVRLLYNNTFREMNLAVATQRNALNLFLTSPDMIELPYKAGDIIKINAMPFCRDIYAVYCGKSFDQINERFQHWCIYNSEYRNGLWIDDVSNRYFSDFMSFEESPLNICEVVQECNDVKIMMVSHLLKNDIELWREWFWVKEHEINDSDSSLDDVVFK